MELHLTGHLQTNKVKKAVKIFDFIHSVDSKKLANKIYDEQLKQNKKVKIFIQVNVGDEDQKSGVTFKDFESFYKKITEDFDLNIIGLMCIPPFVDDTKKYFEKMIDLKSKTNLNELKPSISVSILSAVKL